jgi:hypothetical protein
LYLRTESANPMRPHQSPRNSFSMARSENPSSAQALAILFADELVCALHQALALLQALNFINQFFACVRVIAEDHPVCFDRGSSPSKIFGFVVMLPGLGEMLVDALQGVRAPLFSE